jgi:N-acetylglucosamine-6-phosphate deacetylase
MSAGLIAFKGANVIFPDRVEQFDIVQLRGGRIRNIGNPDLYSADEEYDLRGKYLCPGFVDVHVHGGGGSDFMDLTPEAFRAVCRTHARHGTTSLTPTSTVSSQADYAKFLQLCRDFRNEDTGGSRIVGCHLYGPYFLPAAKGCHPNADFLTPSASHLESLSGYDANFPLTVTIAPELPNAEELTRACIERGIRVNIGHSYATMEQVEAAVAWGARHVDHLFCAMSDRARLRQAQTFPMRAGVMEATLHHDELTTEVIADGKHLNDALLRFAWKINGPDRLALVTDSMRAVDLPDGEYWFGPEGTGEKVRRLNDVGVTLDGLALGSGVMGMDHCVRTMARALKPNAEGLPAGGWPSAGAPLHDVIRMATLTPARILGLDRQIGSIAIGKRADLLVLNDSLELEQVFIGGRRIV